MVSLVLQFPGQHEIDDQLDVVGKLEREKRAPLSNGPHLLVEERLLKRLFNGNAQDNGLLDGDRGDGSPDDLPDEMISYVEQIREFWHESET
jgi:hypothetical protein